MGTRVRTVRGASQGGWAYGCDGRLSPSAQCRLRTWQCDGGWAVEWMLGEREFGLDDGSAGVRDGGVRA